MQTGHLLADCTETHSGHTGRGIRHSSLHASQATAQGQQHRQAADCVLCQGMRAVCSCSRSPLQTSRLVTHAGRTVHACSTGRVGGSARLLVVDIQRHEAHQAELIQQLSHLQTKNASVSSVSCTREQCSEGANIACMCHPRASSCTVRHTKATSMHNTRAACIRLRPCISRGWRL